MLCLFSTCTFASSNFFGQSVTVCHNLGFFLSCKCHSLWVRFVRNDQRNSFDLFYLCHLYIYVSNYSPAHTALSSARTSVKFRY